MRTLLPFAHRLSFQFPSSFFYRSPGHHVDGGSLAEIFVARSATRCRSEEHTSELQSPCNLVCRLLLEKKKKSLAVALLIVSFASPESNPPRPASVICATVVVSIRRSSHVPSPLTMTIAGCRGRSRSSL